METKHVVKTSISILVFVICFASTLVICFASTQRTDGQASGVSANELARRILYERIGSRTTGPKPLEFPANGQTEADEVVETQNGDLKRPLLINGRALTPEQQQKSDK